MVVQIDPSSTVHSHSRQQDRTSHGEPGENRNQAGNGSSDDEGQANSIEGSKHVLQIRGTR